MSQSLPTAVQVFCDATIEKYGELKLDRFLNRVRKLATGTSRAHLVKACYEAGLEIFEVEGAVVPAALLEEIMKSNRSRVAMHGINNRAHRLLEKRVNGHN